MNTVKIKFIAILMIVILAVQFSSAKTRVDSLEEFLTDTRINSSGYANTPNGEISIQATSHALEIAETLSLKLNETEKILLYYQGLHNPDGGFRSSNGVNSSWATTVMGIRGVKSLKVNASQLLAWGLFEYINSTIVDFVYANVTTSELALLTPDVLKHWIEYFDSSLRLSRQPFLPVVSLLPKLQELQLANGSYSHFHIAVRSIYLLSLLGEQPNDPELAKRYILAHYFPEKLFSASGEDNINLVDTLEALIALKQVTELSSLDIVEDITKYILDLQTARSGFAPINETQPTINESWYAVQILLVLNKFSELFTPDVLQEVGFVDLVPIGFVLGIPLVIIYRRREYD